VILNVDIEWKIYYIVSFIDNLSLKNLLSCTGIGEFYVCSKKVIDDLFDGLASIK
jgi:hypothetical protein